MSYVITRHDLSSLSLRFLGIFINCIKSLILYVKKDLYLTVRLLSYVIHNLISTGSLFIVSLTHECQQKLITYIFWPLTLHAVIKILP